MKADEYISTSDAAVALGITRQRVLQLIQRDRLKAQKFANVYMIRRTDLAAVQDRPIGRPPGMTTPAAITPKRAAKVTAKKGGK